MRVMQQSTAIQFALGQLDTKDVITIAVAAGMDRDMVEDAIVDAVTNQARSDVRANG